MINNDAVFKNDNVVYKSTSEFLKFVKNKSKETLANKNKKNSGNSYRGSKKFK